MTSSRRWSHGSAGSSSDWFPYHADDKSDCALISPLEGSFDNPWLPTISGQSCTLSSSTVHELPVDDNDNDDDEATGNSKPNKVLTHISRPPDLAMIAPCPVGSPLLDFRIPAFSEFSDRSNRRALVAYFCNQLSHLIVFREETGNPFQELVLPLTAKSSPVMNAIYALASAHLEYRGVKNQEQSLYFHNQAIQGLATMIDYDGKTAEKRNELLAAIMLLVYYEVVRPFPGLTLRFVAQRTADLNTSLFKKVNLI